MYVWSENFYVGYVQIIRTVSISKKKDTENGGTTLDRNMK